MNNFTKLFTATVVLLLTTILVEAQPTLDPSFSRTGYKLTKIASGRDDIARTVLVQSNGNVLTGGNSFNTIGNSNIAITRLKPNGAYDNTFGTNGIAAIQGGFFCDMALLSNGKIIVAGGGVGTKNVNNFIVYRLRKNGSPDTSFGVGGSVEINIPHSDMICYDVAIQADGKILLAGYQGGSGGFGNMLVVRLKPNGTLDNSFGTGGMFTLYLKGKHSECRQLAIQPDGKIVAGGSIDTLLFFSSLRYDFAAIRLNVNGTLDNSFGSGGIVREDKGTVDISNATALLSDGRIVLGGMSNYFGTTQFAALCLNPNGSIDMSFGTQGWKFIDVDSGTAICETMAIEPDDDIILAGQSYNYLSSGTIYAVALAKINSAGVPDNTFGTAGVYTSMASTKQLGVNNVALQSDGKIVIAGYWYIDGVHSSFFTARYINSASLINKPAFNKEEIAIAKTQQKLYLYPNPVTGNSFNINVKVLKSSHATLAVYDINGKIVFAADYGSTNPGFFTKIVTLPNNISAGMYSVKFSLDGVIEEQKIIITR